MLFSQASYKIIEKTDNDVVDNELYANDQDTPCLGKNPSCRTDPRQNQKEKIFQFPHQQDKKTKTKIQKRKEKIFQFPHQQDNCSALRGFSRLHLREINVWTFGRSLFGKSG